MLTEKLNSVWPTEQADVNLEYPQSKKSPSGAEGIQAPPEVPRLKNHRAVFCFALACTLGTIFAYGGREFFATKGALEYLKLDSDKVLLTAEVLTIASRAYIMYFTRFFSVYNDFKKISEEEHVGCWSRVRRFVVGPPAKADTKTSGPLKLLAITLGLSSIINGIGPALLLCYLGTETLINSFGSTSKALIMSVYIYTFLSTEIGYRAFSVNAQFSNFAKARKKFPTKGMSCTGRLFVLALIALWAIPTMGLFKYKFEASFNGLFGLDDDNDVVSISSWVLSINYLICRLLSRVGDLLRFVSNDISYYEPTGDQKLYPLGAKNQAVVFSGSVAGTIYLMSAGLGATLGGIKHAEDFGLDYETVPAIILIGVVAAFSTSLDYVFAYRRSMLSMYKQENIKCLRPEASSCFGYAKRFFALSDNLYSMEPQYAGQHGIMIDDDRDNRDKNGATQRV